MELDLKKVVLASGILLIVLALGLGFKNYSESPAFCKSCHVMEPAYQSWGNSPHNKVKCVECHADPGFKGFLEAKLNGVRQAAVYFTNPPEPGSANLKADVENDRCIECHRAIDGLNVIAKESLPDSLKKLGLRVNHEGHMEEGVKCSTCHKQAIHNKGNKEVLMPDMDLCFSCHNNTFYNGKKLKKDCTVCHSM